MNDTTLTSPPTNAIGCSDGTTRHGERQSEQTERHRPARIGSRGSGR
jgi:hypothetical protein